MDLIVAIDIIDGNLVRLTKGAYETRQTYGLDPVEVAKEVEGVGLSRLHLVDLDGAKAGKMQNLKVLEAIANTTSLFIDVGGGIRTEEDLASAFDAGAAMANLGSIAVKEPEVVYGWIKAYGPERLILAADSQDGMDKSGGWLKESTLTLEALIDAYLTQGLVHVTATDINRDGMLSGPSTDLYRSLMKGRPSMRLIASGGVSSLDDLVALGQMGLSGAIIGKALYAGRFSLTDLGVLQEQLYG
jgi:phosphoribosylformimino-5-aminoimidazole carboxamide ribotide isomerase